MSASSHTRGHRYAPEYTSTVLAWLDSYGRRVVNNSRALQLEINKIAQYAALRNYGIRARAPSPRSAPTISSTPPRSSRGRSSRSTIAQARASACVFFNQPPRWRIT
jgi:hypothetical protein